MGRITPEPPPVLINGTTKVSHALAVELARDGIVTAPAAAKCGYCGRYGALGSCDGCGAPNQPASAPPIGILQSPFITQIEALFGLPARQPDRMER